MKGLYNYGENGSKESQGSLFLMNVEGQGIDNYSTTDGSTYNEGPKIFNSYTQYHKGVFIENAEDYRIIANQQIFWDKNKNADGTDVDGNNLSDYQSLNCKNSDISNVKFDRCVLPRANFSGASANLLKADGTANDKNWAEGTGLSTLVDKKVTTFVNIQSWLRPSELEEVDAKDRADKLKNDGVFKQQLQDIASSTVRKDMLNKTPKYSTGMTDQEFLKEVAINFEGANLAGVLEGSTGARVFFSGSYIPYSNFKDAKLDHVVFGQSGHDNTGGNAKLPNQGFKQNFAISPALALSYDDGNARDGRKFIDNRTILTGSDFVGASMVGVDMFNATIDDCSFKGVDLSNNPLGLYNLYSAKKVSFEGADLSNSRIGKNDKQENKLPMMGVDFSGANLQECQFHDVDFGENDVDKDGVATAQTQFGSEKNKLSLKFTEFHDCKIEKADIRWAEFDDTYFKNYNINLASQVSATDPRYGIYWPVGYYTSVSQSGGEATLHNVPAANKKKGGFKLGYLSKPLAEIMLANGVFDMNIKTERTKRGDGPDFLTPTGDEQTRWIDNTTRSKKKISNINLDYQADKSFMYEVDTKGVRSVKTSEVWTDDKGKKHYEWSDSLLDENKEFTGTQKFVKWNEDPKLFELKMRLFNKKQMPAKKYPFVSNHWADKRRPKDPKKLGVLPAPLEKEAPYTTDATNVLNQAYGQQKYGYLTHRKPRYNTAGPIPRQRIDCTFSNMSYQSGNDLSGVAFSDCNIFGVDFTNSDMKYVEFVNCHLYECVFNKSDMRNIKMQNSQFDTCAFREVDFSAITEGIDGHGSLEAPTIEDTNFIDCDFTQANLTLVHLKQVNLSNVCFDLTNFTDANLENVAVLKIPVAKTFYEAAASDLTDNSNHLPRRKLYNNLKTALECECEILDNNGEVDDVPGEFGAVNANTGEYKKITDAINSNGQRPDTSNIALDDTGLTFNQYQINKARVKKTLVYDQLVNEIGKAAQEEEKRFCWKPVIDGNNLPNRVSKTIAWDHNDANDFVDLPEGERITNDTYSTELFIGTAHTEYNDKMVEAQLKVAMKEDITGIRGGAYHANFINAIFKNTIFNKFSIDGSTEDLHGVCPECLPLGFLDKLWNNKLDANGNYFTKDCSGNMENLFLYAHLADPAADRNGNNEYMLDSGRPDSQIRLPRQQSFFGLYELKGVLIKSSVNSVSASNSVLGQKETTIPPAGAGSLGVHIDRHMKVVSDRLTASGKTKYHAYAFDGLAPKQGWFAKSSAAKKMTTTPTEGDQTLIYNLLTGQVDTDQNGVADGTGSDGAVNVYGYQANIHDTQGIANSGVYIRGIRRTNNCGFDTMGVAAEAGRDPAGNDLWGEDDRGGKRLDGPTFRERLLARLDKYKGKSDIGRKLSLAGVSRENKNISQVGLPGGSTPWNRIDLRNVILSEANLATDVGEDYFNHADFKWDSPLLKNNTVNYKNKDSVINTSVITRVRGKDGTPDGEAIEKLLAACISASDDTTSVSGARTRREILSNELYIEGRVGHSVNGINTIVGENGLQLVFADLTGANLAGANLTNANLEGALLTNVILHKANLTNANLKGADLRGAQIVDCTLTNALIGYSEMTGEYTKFSDKVDHFTETVIKDGRAGGNHKSVQGGTVSSIQNALPGREKINEAHIFNITSASGPTNSLRVYMNGKDEDGADMFPYGFNMPFLTNMQPSGGSAVNDIGGIANEGTAQVKGGDGKIIYYNSNNVMEVVGRSIGDPKISKKTNAFKEMSVNVDVLKSGLPIMGGRDYTVGLLQNDISYTQIDTTDAIFFNSLKRHGLEQTAFGPSSGNNNRLDTLMGTDLYMMGKSSIRVKDSEGAAYPGIKIARGINYDTVWNLSNRIDGGPLRNHSDYREIYIITHLRADKKQKDVQAARTVINFPPNMIWEETSETITSTKGGEYAHFHPNILNVDQQDRSEYKKLHYQPRFDFSTPDKLEEGEIRTKFDNCDMSLCIMPYSNFINASAVGTNFSGALLRGCDFSGADLTGVDFSTCYGGDGTDFAKPTEIKRGNLKGGVRTDLVKTNFTNAKLEGVNFNTANLAYADFTGADISGATFWGANIAHADFTRAMIGDIYLGDISGSITGHGANFIGAGPWYFVQPGIEKCESIDENGKFLDDNDSRLSTEGYDTTTANSMTTRVTQQMIYKEFWTLADELILTDYKYGKDGVNYTSANGDLIPKKDSVDKDKTAKLRKLVYYNHADHPYWSNGSILGTSTDDLEDDILNNDDLAENSVGRLAFKFYYEAQTQPYSKIYNKTLMESEDKDKDGQNILAKNLIKAHGGNILMNVMPKFPKGFNTAAALGWERDTSGVVITHFRKGGLFFNNVKDDDLIADNKPYLAKSVIDGILANAASKTLGPDPANTNGYVDISNVVNGVNYGASSTAIASIVNLEHGYGLDNDGKEQYKKTQTALACNYYDTFSEPIKGLDISGMVFVKSDRSVAASFEGVDFTKPGAHTEMAFVNSDMSGVDFSGCVFPGFPGVKKTTFTNNDLSGANLSFATLKGANFDISCTLTGMKFHGADLTGTNFNGADLTNVEFTNVSVSQKDDTAVNIKSGLVHNAIIQNCNFTDVKNPFDAKWPLGTDISMVCGIKADGERITPTRDDAADKITLYEEIAAGRRNFINKKFVKGDFTLKNAAGTTLVIDFSGCCLKDAVFEHGNTLSNGYDGLSLAGVNFNDCDLTGANFAGVNLTGAIFTNETLFSQTVFVGALHQEAAKSWPQGFNYDIAIVDNLNNYKSTSKASGNFLNWIYHSGADWNVMKAAERSDPDLYKYWSEVEGCRTWDSLWFQGLQGLENSAGDTNQGIDISNALVGRFAVDADADGVSDYGVDLTLQGRFSRHDMSSNNPTALEKALGYPRIVAGGSTKNIFENLSTYTDPANNMSVSHIAELTNLIVKSTTESYSGNTVVDASQNKHMFLGANLAHVDLKKETFNSKDSVGAGIGGIVSLKITGSSAHMTPNQTADNSANALGNVAFTWEEAGSRFKGQSSSNNTFELSRSNNDNYGVDTSGAWVVSDNSSNLMLYYKKVDSESINELFDNTTEWTIPDVNNSKGAHDHVQGSKPPSCVENTTTYANLHVFDLSGAYVAGANFTNADLSGVSFTNCEIDFHKKNNSIVFKDLRGCNFTGADLTNVDFSGCDIEDCIFTYAKIKNTNFGWTDNSAKARFPGGFDFKYQTAADGSQRSTYDYTDATVSIREFLGSMRGWKDNVNNIHIGIHNDDGTTDANGTTVAASQANRLYTSTQPNVFLRANYYPVTVSASDSSQSWEAHAGADTGKVWVKEAESTGLIPSSGKEVNRTILDKNAGPNRDVSIATGELEKYDFTKNRWDGCGAGYNFKDMTNLFTYNGVTGGTVTDQNSLSGLQGEISLINLDLRNANLQNSSFASSNIKGINLSGADISGLDLSGACLSTPGDNTLKVNITGALMSVPSTGTIDVDVKGNTPQTQFRSCLKNETPNEYSELYNIKDAYLVGLNNLIAEDVKFSNAATRDSTAYDFSGCSLKNASFNNSSLAHVSFVGANLEGASFIGCDLSGTNFTKANIRGADFRGADLSGTIFTSAFWNGGTKMPAGLVSGNQDMINITNKNQDGVNWANKQKGSVSGAGNTYAPVFNGDASFKYDLVDAAKRIKAGRKAQKQEIVDILCKDSGCTNDFVSNQGPDLAFWNNGESAWDLGSNVKNTSSNNTNALDLSNVTVLFQDKTIFPLSTEKTGARKTTKFQAAGTNQIIETQLDLSGANLKSADLKNSNLSKANLSYAMLDNVDISATDFTEADMYGATLKNTPIVPEQRGNIASGDTDGYAYFSTYMENMTITNMDFSGVVFENKTDFTGSNILDVSFNETILVNACFNYCNIGSSDAKIAANSNTTFENASTDSASFVGVDMSHVNISGMHCGDIDFSGATLEDLSFSRIDDHNLGYSIFDNATVKNCDLSGDDANNPLAWNGSAINTTFEVCTFTRFDVHNCNDMDFSGATFTNCTFEDCDLKGAKFDYVNFDDQNLSDCSLNGIILNNADLSGTIINDVSNVVWTNGPLKGVDISNATLKFTQMVNIDQLQLYTCGSAPEKGSCFDGLSMEGVDFTKSGGFQGSTWKNCTITNVELSGCDLSGNDFTNATINMTDYDNDAAAQAAGICNSQAITDNRYTFETSWKQEIARAINGYTTKDGAINFKGAIIPVNTFVGLTDISCVESLAELSVTSLNLDGITVGPRAANMQTIDVTGKPKDNGKRMDMSGASLVSLSTNASSKLNYVDLTNANLTGADINGEAGNSIFTRANLTNATITADVSNSVFIDVSFNNADLIGVNLSTCVLTNVEFIDADLSGVKMPPPPYSVTSFAGANLGGDPADATAYLDLSNADLGGLSFLDASLNNVDFGGSDMNRVILTQTDSPTVADGNARRALVKAALTDLSLVSLDYAVLRDMSFAVASTPAVKFSEILTGLYRTDFSGSDMSGVVFDGLTIEECNFHSCDLSAASFKNCTLTRNCWENADLHEMDVEGATLNYEILTGLCETTEASGDWKSYYAGSGIRSQGWEDIKNLQKATLNNVSFEKGELGTGSGDAVNSWTSDHNDLTGIKMHNGIFSSFQGKVDFSGADLTGSSFKNADLTDSDFVLANLTSCNFDGADLSGVDFSGANLTKCNLNNTDLSGVNMMNTLISETSFFMCKNAIHIDFSGVDLHRYYDSVDGSLSIDLSGTTKFVTPNHVYEFPNRGNMDTKGFRLHTETGNAAKGHAQIDTNIAFDISQNVYGINTVGMMGCDGVPEKDHPPINENDEYPDPVASKTTPYEKSGWKY